MNPFDDPEHFHETLTRVEPYDNDTYEISFDGGWVTAITSPDIEPKVGDRITFWGSKWGVRRGFALNGEVVEYRDHAQHQAWWDEQLRERQEKQKAEYEAQREDNNRRVDELPQVFADRITIFREYAPDWAWNYEGYELFCCEEAVKIAEHFKSAEAIQEFSKKDYSEQIKEFNASDQHSGNTWGVSLHLAYVFLSDPELVPSVHGALCPLVGCKEYGCYAARRAET